MSAATGRRSRARRGEGEQLREDILAAAEALLLESGDMDAVSIRAVATAAGVTPPSIYLHFADKAELLFAICEKHFQALGAAMEDAMAGLGGPVEKLRAIGRAYVRFGLDHPQQYATLFMEKAKLESIPHLSDRMVGLSEFGRVVAVVQEGIDAGHIAQTDAFLTATGMWTTVHGIVAGVIATPFFPWPDVDVLVEHVIDVHCRGMSA